MRKVYCYYRWARTSFYNERQIIHTYLKWNKILEADYSLCIEVDTSYLLNLKLVIIFSHYQEQNQEVWELIQHDKKQILFNRW